jgi:hypothetical protein
MAGNNVQRNFVGNSRLCPKCQTEIMVTEAMVRRKNYTCGPCQSKAATEWAKANREKKRASNNAYHKKISGMRSERTAAYRASHPDRKAAHQAVQTAIRNRSLGKAACIVCGSEKSSAHHEDYSRPLDVVWYCHVHHMQRHAMIAARGAA